jgi:hypothetical protein
MAKVRKRTWVSRGAAKTAWVVDYRDQTGRHIQTFQSKKAAEGFMLQVGHDIREGIHTSRAASITVGEAADLWLTACGLNGLERSTLKQYRAHVKHHIAPLLGSVKLAELSTPRIQRFADALIDRPSAADSDKRLSRSMARKVSTPDQRCIGWPE